MVDFWLKKEFPENSLPKSFIVNINGSTYTGEFIKDESLIPLLGEEVKIFIRRTRFRLKLDQVKDWLQIYGTIVGDLEYISDKDEPDILTDDITCRMCLSKHIPGQLPAYGRKLSVTYRGQPILCGACFSVGHKRSNCNNLRADWLVFSEALFNLEPNITSQMLGRWYDLIKEHRYRPPEQN